MTSGDKLEGMPILTADQMRAAEKRCFELGTQSYDLMQRAGLAVVDVVQRRWSDRARRILVLAGPGNNGGDGFIVARGLSDLGYDVTVAAAHSPTEYRGDAAKAAATVKSPFLPLTTKALRAWLIPDTLIVDAVFGIGLTRPVAGDPAELFRAGNACGAPIVAVDMPSGVQADSGEILGSAIQAAVTVTFGWPKCGHLLLPGRGLAGDLVVADIGLQAGDLTADARACAINGPAIWRGDFPRQGQADHKYSRGHAVVVGGTRMPGAARLAARAARRVGVGMLTVLTEEAARCFYLADQPGLIVNAMAGVADLTAALADRRVTAFLVGSGLPPDAETRSMVLAALASGKPGVIDGGGLSAFAGDIQYLKNSSLDSVVLTPHEGEFERLFPDLKGSKLDRARAAAKESGAIVVLKGADTIIAAPGGQAIVNANAPVTLATAGSGDVLAGVVLGLLAQDMPAFNAAAAAVWLHGAAAQAFGPGLIAEDLPDTLPAVLRQLEMTHG